MSNHDIARLLRQVVTAYVIQDEKKFKFQIIAYGRAADSIENATSEVQDLFKEGKLDQIPGVGPSIKQHLSELCTTGHVKHFDEMIKGVPAAIYPLLDLPSFGPKTAYKLVKTFDLDNPKTVLKDLEKIAQEGKIAELEGFGEKSQSEILNTLQNAELGNKSEERMPLPFASEMADKIIEYMKKCKEVKAIYPLGSLRRKVSTIGDIDLAVATDEPKKVLDHFIEYPYKSRVLDRGESISASFLTTSGRRVDIKTQSAESFGALLQHFTGSKAHNVHLREIAIKKDMSLSEKGIKFTKLNTMKIYDTEEKFYKALGMDWIPPEMREDEGEIELAQKHEIPHLVELKDIKGDFHIHSNFNIEPSHDLGASTMETLLKKATELKYDYLSFSEHNPSVSKHSAKEIETLIEKRNNELHEIYSRIKNDQNKSVRVIKMLETDIMTNGNLAIGDDALALLDGSIVSIHSSFQMDKETMTNRILKGLSHPKAKIFAHPTGRLINTRPGYTAEWGEIFAYCAEHNKALEINAHPSRLDLTDALIRVARKYKVKFSLGSDSHAVDQMDLMQYGVDVARRGWLTKNDIINCMKYEDLMNWFKS